jgi:hypothetical protein
MPVIGQYGIQLRMKTKTSAVVGLPSYCACRLGDNTFQVHTASGQRTHEARGPSQRQEVVRTPAQGQFIAIVLRIRKSMMITLALAQTRMSSFCFTIPEPSIFIACRGMGVLAFGRNLHRCSTRSEEANGQRIVDACGCLWVYSLLFKPKDASSPRTGTKACFAWSLCST